MNAANFFSGIAVILVGVCLFFAGPQLILVPSTHVQVTELFHDETLAVSEVGERSAQLDEGVTVNGTVTVSSALTGGPSDIPMFVADDANYQKWSTHGSPTYAFQRDLSSGQDFSFTVPRNRPLPLRLRQYKLAGEKEGDDDCGSPETGHDQHAR